MRNRADARFKNMARGRSYSPCFYDPEILYSRVEIICHRIICSFSRRIYHNQISVFTEDDNEPISFHV